MSILIKCMEMPTSCSRCPMLEGDRLDGLCHAASRWLDDDEYWTWYAYPEGDMDDSKPCNCPLVPVQPHGDLIDRDALFKTMENTPWYNNADRDEIAETIVCDAPTIIPAEESES